MNDTQSQLEAVERKYRCWQCGQEVWMTEATWAHGNNHDHYTPDGWCGEFEGTDD